LRVSEKFYFWHKKIVLIDEIFFCNYLIINTSLLTHAPLRQLADFLQRGEMRSHTFKDFSDSPKFKIQNSKFKIHNFPKHKNFAKFIIRNS